MLKVICVVCYQILSQGLFKNVFKIYLIVFCLHVCLCITGVFSACKGQEVVLDPLKQMFHTVMNNHVDARIEPRASARTVSSLNN